MNLSKAIEIFVHGHCRRKSAASPYLPKPQDGLWILRDGPGRKGAPRKIEVVTDLPPEETVRVIRKEELGWHFIAALFQDPAQHGAVKDEYKALGYRAMSTEWMFVHDLHSIPKSESTPPVRELADQEALDRVRQAC